MNKLSPLVILFLLASTGFELLAQSGNNDSTFNPTDPGFGLLDGANGNVWTSAVQADGKVIIGGQFTKYNGVSKNCIARINADGSVDQTFQIGTGAGGAVKSIAIQPDGKIIIGGDFTSYNSSSRYHIARLNADGSLDNTFNPSFGAGNEVLACAVQADGKIVIGGLFTFYNDSTRNYIARINPNGSLDTSFVIGSGFGSQVYALAIQPDGKILVGGGFSIYNGTTRKGIARLDSNGSLDMGFNPGTNVNNVRSIILQAGGKIVITGWFSTINGTSRNNIARLNSDGSLDAGFNPGSGANGGISSCALQNDGKLIIAGPFTMVDETPQKYIARLNSNGSVDQGFHAGPGPNNYINHVALLPDGNVLAAGEFTIFSGMARGFISKLLSDGQTDIAFNHAMGANSTVFCHAILPGGKILIGGTFTAYNSKEKNAIALLHADGSVDTTFKPSTEPNSSILAIYPQPDGKIIIVGWFSLSNQTGKKCLARLEANGSLDNTFTLGDGSITAIYASAMQPDGKLIIAGDFSSYNGTNRQRVARINTDGSVDMGFTPGIGADNAVLTTALQADGKIIIGGWFTSYQGKTSNRIARINSNGSLDSTFITGSGLNNPMDAIAVQADGKILIGGRFTTYNGTGASRIARLNVDGSIDNTFNTGSGANNSVLNISMQSDGKILMGGAFDYYNGTAGKGLARINSNGSIDASFQVGSGTNGSVSDISVQSDGKVIIGGDFTGYNGKGRSRIARVIGVCANNTVGAASSTPAVCVKTAIAPVTHTTTGTNGIGAATGLPAGVTATWIANTITISGKPTQSGVFNYSIPLNGGCNPVSATGTITVNSPDISITRSGNVFTAGATGASYQWVDCSNNYTPISGATNQVFTASSSGTYAVIVTQNGCTDTSTCAQLFPTALDEHKKAGIALVYPNPSQGNLTITLHHTTSYAEVVILNACGQEVFRKQYHQADKLPVNFEGTPGLYLLKVKTGGEETGIFKIIKM